MDFETMRPRFDAGLPSFSRQGMPEAPTGLTVTQRDAVLDLRWDGVPGVTWTVYRSAEIDDFSSAEILLGGLTRPAAVDMDEMPQAPCCYWVTASMLRVESMPSLAALGHLLPPQGRAVLTAMAVSGSRAVRLDWTAGDVDLETAWTLYSKGPAETGFSRQQGLTNRFMSFAAASTGTWEFYVKAVNALGEGPGSNTVKVPLTAETAGAACCRPPLFADHGLCQNGPSVYPRP